MSEDGNAPDQGGKSDELLKNMKAEFDRKLNNVNETIERQNKQMEEYLKSIVSAAASTPKEDPTELEDLKYTDPDKYIELKLDRKIKAETDAIRAEQQKAASRQQEQQKLLLNLSKDYPEINDANSELYQAAVSTYDKMSDAEKTSSAAYKIAILSAAADLGVLPMSKRSSNAGEDFSFKGSDSSRRSERRQKSDDELDPKTIEFARLLGRDINDPEVVKRLKEYSKRKGAGWLKWE